MDPEARTVEVFSLDPATETPLRSFTERDTVASDVLPSLDLPLEALWG